MAAEDPRCVTASVAMICSCLLSHEIGNGVVGDWAREVTWEDGAFVRELAMG